MSSVLNAMNVFKDMMNTPSAQDGGKKQKKQQKKQKGGNSCQANMEGGAKKAKKTSKKPLSQRQKLENKTVEELKKKAIRQGIKIYKKKDGKLVPVKKSTLVSKILEKST